MITNYLMSLTQSQLGLTTILIITTLFLIATLCMPLGLHLIESKPSTLKTVAGISSFLLSFGLFIFLFGFNPVDTLQNYTSSRSDKYYMTYHNLTYQLHKKLKPDQKLNDQVKIVNQKSDELVGIVKCGEISVKECFDQINASSVSSNTEVDHNTIVVSNKDE